MTTSRNKFFLSTLFLSFLVILGSCNSSDKKNTDANTKAATNTVDSANKIAGDPAAINAISFKDYKLTRQAMMEFETNKQAKKIILKIELNDLGNPSNMNLYAYPAKNAANGGEGEAGSMIPQENAITFANPTDIRIGNNELVFKDFKQNGQWAQFDYILLTPARKINSNGSYDLVFKISYHDNKKNLIDIAGLPLETNPSPPAKPAD